MDARVVCYNSYHRVPDGNAGALSGPILALRGPLPAGLLSVQSHSRFSFNASNSAFSHLTVCAALGTLLVNYFIMSLIKVVIAERMETSWCRLKS